MKRARQPFSCWIVGLVIWVALASCSPDPEMDGGTDGDVASDREDSVAACQDGVDNDGDGMVDCVDPDCISVAACDGVDGDADSDADTDLEECRSINVAAEAATAPVDIVWVIDSSGSMRGEAAIVQDNMNAFVAAISSAGIDHHVVVMTHRDYVDVPPPLGEDFERYLFIHQPVWSDQPLELLLSNFARYSFFIRPRGALHFVAVTDDETPTEPAAFLSEMEERLGREFTFHAIASEVAFHDCVGGVCEEGCEGPNGAASAIGERYYELADLTGGEQFSICTSDWSALFDTLSEAVILSAALPCFYDLPEPPAGMVFDPERVNVVLTDESGEETTLARAMTPEACEDHLAWYFDDNEIPTRIVLCPAACELVEGLVRGEVDIALGCEPGEIIY